MSRRVIGSLIGVAGLLMLAAAIWLPVDFGHAAPRPTRLPSDLAIVSGDCALFVTFRPGDFTKDPLARTLTDYAEMSRDIERAMSVALADIERLTLANVVGEVVSIVRSRKPIDKEKVLRVLEPYRDRGFKDKKAGAREEKPALSEKKVGGKTILFYGPPGRWTQSLCILDRTSFAFGNLKALETLFGSAIKRSEAMDEMLGLAGKHTLVAGFQGKQVRHMLSEEFRRYDYEERGKYEKEVPAFKEKGDFKDSPKDRSDATRRAEPGTKGTKTDGVMMIPPELLPYKPLVMMKTALITADINRGYTVNAQITFANKEATDEGETAMKTMLYVFRELAPMLPKVDRSFRPLKPLTEPVQKAIASSRIERSGTTLSTGIKLTLADGMLKTVNEEIASEKKRREEMRKRYELKDVKKDGRPFADKEKEK